jgi:hypothetical protein
MEKKKADTVNVLGFWSSVSATVCSAVFLAALVFTLITNSLNLNWQSIDQYAKIYNELQVMIFVVPCFLLAPSILIFTACLYAKAPEAKKILALLAMVFAIVYTAQISYNYFMQMSAVRQSIKAGVLDGLAPFAFGNPNSTFWSLEVLGYTFLSISMVFSGLLFKGSRVKAWIRWIFIINGILGIWAIFEAVLEITTPPISLLLFALSFPVSTAIIAALFRKDRIYQ